METSIQVPARPLRRRRWFSYSLRSLLLLTTIAATILGVWVSRAERQRRAVAAIEEAGGDVVYEAEPDRLALGPRLLKRWLGPDYVADVVFVQFKPSTTDAGLVHLRAMTELELLWLGNTRVSDAGLVHLRGLAKLRTLGLGNTQVSDAGLAHLRGLTKLKFLGLANTRVSDAGCDRLRQVLPGCGVDRSPQR